MGTPTFTLLNHTDINLAESVTGWIDFDTLDTDIKKQGANGITGTFRADGEEGYYDNGSAPVTAVGKTFRKWINTTNVPYMETEANGGYELLIYDGTVTQYLVMFGSDTYFGGWVNVVIDMDYFATLSPAITLANVQRWGVRVNHATSGKNVDNMWTDAYRYLDGYSMTGGTSPDPITLVDVELSDRISQASPQVLLGYGILTVFGGVYYATGDIQFGTGATTTFFDMDGDILVFEDKPVASGLYSLSGVGSGTQVSIKNNSTITSAGNTDTTRFAFDWSDTNLLDFSCTDSLIVRSATATFNTSQQVTGNTFNDCGQIIHAGAIMNNCTVKNYEGTANTSALIYNVNADPDGEMDGMTFLKGTAATHAIEFGLLSPTTMTLRNVTCGSYNASDSQNDSTFHFKRTSGTVTLNLVGFTGNYSYRTDGATINIVADPVTVKATATTTDGTPVENVLVLLKATSSSPEGPFPVSVSVTIARSGSPESLAIITHSGHGMASNDKVVIEGANQEEYNGVKTITVIDTSSYSFSVTSSPLPATPATGTITATFAALYGLTDVNGEISASRVYPADQLVIGWGRKMSGTPYYKEGILTGSVSSTTGFDKSAVMSLDE